MRQHRAEDDPSRRPPGCPRGDKEGRLLAVLLAVAFAISGCGAGRPPINGLIAANTSTIKKNAAPGQIVSFIPTISGPAGAMLIRVLHIIPVDGYRTPELRHTGVTPYGGGADGWPIYGVEQVYGQPVHPFANIAVAVSAPSDGLWAAAGAVVTVRYRGTDYQIRAIDPFLLDVGHWASAAVQSRFQSVAPTK